ncbi:terminase small subunit protein [Chryseobacterium bernardetii]|uniref:terminase small subunit-like protein n=1 Tax=Chryseobacterium bernardetii TaxID=1241978 RepID=UPI00162AA7F9|nr:terminase small subunit protein [Chryseobacterium bernardetii]
MAYDEKTKEEVFSKIITEIADVGTPLRTILKRKGMPSSSTFFIWLNEDDSLSKRYAQAKEIQVEALADEILEIADDGSNDYMTIIKGDMEYNVENKEVTNRSRLRVDTRKWLLSKIIPKKYGDKIDITSDGEKVTGSIPVVLENGRTIEDLKNDLKLDEEC